MVAFLVVVLVLVVMVLGVSSIMQSYASAKQAEAVIETAQAAQMATFGNVAVILLLVIVVLAVLFAVMYLVVSRMPTRATRGALPHFSRQTALVQSKRATSGIRTHDLTVTNRDYGFSREDLQRILAEMNALDETEDEYADLYEEDAR